MAELTVPHISGCDGGRESSTPGLVVAKKRAEVAGASGDHDDFPGSKILHKKAKWVKFYGTRVIFGKLTNGDKRGDNSRRK